MSLKRCTAAMRSSGDIRGHSPSSKALRAAATARSMSAVVPSGTRPTTSSVCGEMTSMTSEPAGATHSPPMKSLSWTCMVFSCVRDGGSERFGQTEISPRATLPAHG